MSSASLRTDAERFECLSCQRPLHVKRVTGGVAGRFKNELSILSGTVKSVLSIKDSGHNFTSLKHCDSCGASLWVGFPRYTCQWCKTHQCAACCLPVCQYGSTCYNHTPEHRKRFAHPEGTLKRWRACRYGLGCTSREPAHVAEFAHPGDQNYRFANLVFERGLHPEFGTLWQLFKFHDTDDSGFLSQTEFNQAFSTCARLVSERPRLPPSDTGRASSSPAEVVGLLHAKEEDEEEFDEPRRAALAWEAVGGEALDHIGFASFASWATDGGLELPVGLEAVEAEQADRPCRFRGQDGSRCNCPSFRPADGDPRFCACGHKTSMHRSEAAERPSTQLGSATAGMNWVPEKAGLVEVTDSSLLASLQDLLRRTHKSSDNWTRDRGCQLHGVNGCELECIRRNRAPVPQEYKLVAAYRNQNLELWGKYALFRTAVAEEVGEAGCTPVAVHSQAELDSGLQDRVNEWRLLHGSSLDNLRRICDTNFRVTLAGSGATWKDPGKGKGTPLYGYGMYFAEHVTKADEYAKPIPAGEEHEGGHALLVCRVIGGKVNSITSNDIDTEKLRADILEGPYHSILGDRVVSLKKPYREVVVYDKDQVYPEFLLTYSRVF